MAQFICAELWPVEKSENVSFFVAQSPKGQGCYVESLTGQRHDRTQTESQELNCKSGQMFRACCVSSARCSK